MSSTQNSFESIIISLLENAEVKNLLQDIGNAAAEKIWERIQTRQSESLLLSLNEVCVKFSISKATVHNWCNKGVLQRHKIPKSNRTFFKASEVESKQK